MSARNMPGGSNHAIEDFLTDLVQEYQPHLQQTGCYGDGKNNTRPSLANDILPMFRERWTAGPSQRTAAIFPNIYPALQLASRLLMEDLTLLWFCRLTFGSRHQSPEQRGIVYVEETSEMYTPGAIAKVKANLAELGQVITFMFTPPGYTKESHGTEYPDKTSTSFYKEIARKDWPPIDDKYRSSRYHHLHPCVVMGSAFQTFFSETFSGASLRHRYCFWFTFAVALVHEIAHAYWHWLHDRDIKEPLWHRGERQNELGYSWERNVIGRVTHPMRYVGDRGYKFLFSIQLEPYTNSEELGKAMKGMWSSTQAEYTFLDARGKERVWPLLDPSDRRGRSESFLGYPSKSFVCAIHCYPMAWTVAWFQESEWRKWKQQWVAQNKYIPQPLIGAFMLIYERKPEVAHIWRPLVPSVGQDLDARKIMKKLKSG